MPNVSEYEKLGKAYRKELFEKFLATKQGHPGSVFSMMDIVIVLYHGGFNRFDSNKKEFMDRVVISKGHATAALYPIMKNFGVLPEEEWKNWGHSSSLLRVFGNTSMPGIDVTSGSLGHGVGVGAGMALAAKARKEDTRIYAVISEGELYEESHTKTPKKLLKYFRMNSLFEYENYNWKSITKKSKGKHCNKCGRNSHYASNCYAKKHVKGYSL